MSIKGRMVSRGFHCSSLSPITLSAKSIINIQMLLSSMPSIDAHHNSLTNSSARFYGTAPYLSATYASPCFRLGATIDPSGWSGDWTSWFGPIIDLTGWFVSTVDRSGSRVGWYDTGAGWFSTTVDITEVALLAMNLLGLLLEYQNAYSGSFQLPATRYDACSACWIATRQVASEFQSSLTMRRYTTNLSLWHSHRSLTSPQWIILGLHFELSWLLHKLNFRC